jgi:hypothetical protein
MILSLFLQNDELFSAKQHPLGDDRVLLKPAMLDIAPILTAENPNYNATATPRFKCFASQV